MHEHKSKLNPNSFTAKYNVSYLLYYEHYGWVQQAIEREKEIKLLKRDRKLELIKNFNSNLDFLNDTIWIEMLSARQTVRKKRGKTSQLFSIQQKEMLSAWQNGRVNYSQYTPNKAGIK